VDAIHNGFSGELFNSTLEHKCEYFGYADAFDAGTGKYFGLCATVQPRSVIIGDSVLLKPEVATRHMAAITPPQGTSEEPLPGKPNGPRPPSASGNDEPAPLRPVVLKTRFFGSVEIPPQKITSTTQKVVDEVIQHLSATYGTKVKITLDIEAENAEGF